MSQADLRRFTGPLRASEDALLALALAAMAVLPLSEMVLRATLNRGIPGAASLTQHLTLVVGMVGAAVAARRALALFRPARAIRGAPASAAQVVSSSVTAPWRVRCVTPRSSSC
jgi:TRAP-type C4-dicarboxylate transport system permease small subunit